MPDVDRNGIDDRIESAALVGLSVGMVLIGVGMVALAAGGC